MSEKFNLLVESAEGLLPLLPWCVRVCLFVFVCVRAGVVGSIRSSPGACRACPWHAPASDVDVLWLVRAWACMRLGMRMWLRIWIDLSCYQIDPLVVSSSCPTCIRPDSETGVTDSHT